MFRLLHIYMRIDRRQQVYVRRYHMRRTHPPTRARRHRRRRVSPFGGAEKVRAFAGWIPGLLHQNCNTTQPYPARMYARQPMLTAACCCTTHESPRPTRSSSATTRLVHTRPVPAGNSSRSDYYTHRLYGAVIYKVVGVCAGPQIQRATSRA